MRQTFLLLELHRYIYKEFKTAICTAAVSAKTVDYFIAKQLNSFLKWTTNTPVSCTNKTFNRNEMHLSRHYLAEISFNYGDHTFLDKLFAKIYLYLSQNNSNSDF